MKKKATRAYTSEYSRSRLRLPNLKHQIPHRRIFVPSRINDLFEAKLGQRRRFLSLRK